MSLVYRTSKWLQRLWAEHLEISAPARTLVQQGVERRPDFPRFPDDLHARLYLPKSPKKLSSAPEWATRLLAAADELNEFARLRLMTAKNPFSSGIATEALLEQLIDQVPSAPPMSPSSKGRYQRRPANEASQPRNPRELPDAQHAGVEQQAPTDSDLRAVLRRAARAARVAIEDTEAGLEGISTPLGFSMPGTSVVSNPGPANLKAVRAAHTRLSTSRRLRRIAELAGRLERIAAQKARSNVKPGVGEVHGIGLGGLSDLARVLPGELVALRRKKLRLAFLARLLQGRALTYAVTGREPQARGPIVVLLDESASMREGGKSIWSKAVALTLLSTATKQRRAWHLVAFNGRIIREATVPAGKATPADIVAALDHGCGGGTDFNAPVLRAVELIRSAKRMSQADVVIVTDGEDSVAPEAIEAAHALTKAEGVSWFVVGVGASADLSLKSLAPIATSMVRVRNVDDADELIVPVLNLDKE